jgi:hypothetical protein
MIIEWFEKCQKCKGTGLYKGMGERDGIAVVCHNCNGTGKKYQKHEYEEFTEREICPGVERVIQTNPGICVGAKNEKDDTFGGMTYKEWLAGKAFAVGMEMRLYTCPAWWYQIANYDLKPRWDSCIVCGMFSGCQYFENKAACWERWDAEYKRGEIKP